MHRDSQRVPTTEDSLRILKDCDIEIGSVLDVGVLTGTAPLIHALPHLPHHLFEPVDLHFGAIEKNYRNLNHKIHRVALSDEDGEAFVACRSIHNDGKITHAELVERPVTAADLPGFVSCTAIPKARLDTIMAQEQPATPFLLKIDVDGHEMSVLRGATETLENTSIVIIEAPLNRVALPHFFERSAFLMNAGFHLMDIAELAYYDGVLWQVDLVFVRTDIVARNNRLRPFESKGFTFQRDRWYPYSERKLKG